MGQAKCRLVSEERRGEEEEGGEEGGGGGRGEAGIIYIPIWIPLQAPKICRDLGGILISGGE